MNGLFPVICAITLSACAVITDADEAEEEGAELVDLEEEEEEEPEDEVASDDEAEWQSEAGMSGNYIAVVRNNSILKCNQGRAASVYGLALFPNDTSLAYPTASNKIVLENNASDAATRWLHRW